MLEYWRRRGRGSSGPGPLRLDATVGNLSVRLTGHRAPPRPRLMHFWCCPRHIGPESLASLACLYLLKLFRREVSIRRRSSTSARR